MELTEVIRNRRTILEYKSDKMDKDELLHLFNTAAFAPNHHMRQPWKLKIYEDEARSVFGEKVVDSYIRLGLLKTKQPDKLAKARQGYDRFFNSVPHHILFYMDKQDDGGYVDDENFAAVCAFIQNFQLLAWEKGIGTMWTAKQILLDERFIRDVGLSSKKHKLIAVVQAGYPKKVPEAKERAAIDENLEWIHTTQIKGEKRE